MQKATTRKTSSKTTPTATLQRRATIKPTVPQVRFPSPQESIQRTLNTHLTRPSNVQRQMATPALQAAHLYTSEHQQAQHQTASLQRQINELQMALPTNAIQSALQRQAQASTPTQQRPVTPGDWAVTMQREAARIEGKALNTQQHGQFMALQRHVTQTLVQGFRQDRQPAPERYAQYGSHLATLQRHPISGQVAHATMRLIPPGERPALQRAVDEALQRQQEQDAQDSAAFNLQALQRQLAEQETSNQQSVMQRIQERRGSGNPLPESVQRHLEHGLNHDLSGVRIHDDAEADKMAKGVNAIAFTTGKDIFFQSGKFNPNTQTGLELLAHEVTHTVQQSQGKVGKGIDPDSGLEQEARDMGRKIAHTTPTPHTSNTPVRFGNRQPGALTQARQPLQRTPDSNAHPSIQRWGLGDLKKLASSAKNKVTNTVQKVKQSAQSAIKTTTKKVKAIASPAVKAVKKSVQKVSQAVQKGTAKAKKIISKASKTVRQYGAKTLSKIKQKAQSVKTKATRVVQKVKQGAQRLAARTAKVYQQVKTAAKQKVNQTKEKIKQAAKTTGRKIKTTATQITNSIKQKAQPLIAKAKQKAAELKQKAQQTIEKAKVAVQNSGNRIKQTYEQAKTAAKKAAVQGWNATVAGAKNAGKFVAEKVNAIKNNPRVQATANFLKEAGIQVAKVGTAIVVGGVVIAGAAALTAATGGLAGPALVAALFASGALGGAASQVVENALRGKKWNQGITAKSMAVDGTLGIALGPLAKVAGGVVRGVGKPILTGIGKAANKYTPTFVAGARTLGRNAAGIGRSAIATAQSVGRSIRDAVAPRLATVRGITGPALSTAGRIVRDRLSNSVSGRAFNAADTVFSRTVRGVNSRLSAAGVRGGNKVKAGVDRVKTFINARPNLKKALSKPGKGWEAVKDRAALANYKGQSRVSKSWADGRRSLVRFERRIRDNMSSRGYQVDSNVSFTSAAFAAAERSMASMSKYASGEAKTIANEVREQWFGSAGIGGVLRTGRKMDELVTAHPVLRQGWKQEMNRAKGALVSQQAKKLRLQAQATGQQLSKRAAKKQARQAITPDDVYAHAVNNTSGQFMAQASRTYAAQVRTAQTGFDPGKNILTQLPNAYRVGAGQMWNDARDKFSTLRNAGGMAAGISTAGGWVAEEVSKTFVGGMAGAYKSEAGWHLPTEASFAAGRDKVTSDLPKNVITAMTGALPEAQGGKLALAAPFDRNVKTQAAIGGYAGTTVSNELTFDPDAAKKAEEEETSHP